MHPYIYTCKTYIYRLLAIQLEPEGILSLTTKAIRQDVKHAFTHAFILQGKGVARGGKTECSLPEPSHRRSQSIWQPCSVAVAGSHAL